MFSPDGRWIAFTSDRSGQDEIYVKAYPGEGGIVPRSTDGGSESAWARDGGSSFIETETRGWLSPSRRNQHLRQTGQGYCSRVPTGTAIMAGHQTTMWHPITNRQLTLLAFTSSEVSKIFSSSPGVKSHCCQAVNFLATSTSPMPTSARRLSQMTENDSPGNIIV